MILVVFNNPILVLTAWPTKHQRFTFMNGSIWINEGSIVAKSELLTTNFYEQRFIYN